MERNCINKPLLINVEQSAFTYPKVIKVGRSHGKKKEMYKYLEKNRKKKKTRFWR